jgi:isoleucyl-tRNA synthetase
VQQARRDAGFDVSDRITLQVGGGSAVVAAVQAHADLIRSETLAASLDVTQRSLGSDGVDIGDKQQVALEVSRA